MTAAVPDGVQMPATVETVFVALAAAAVDAKDEGIGAQPVERFDDDGLGVVADRIATRLLVAGLEQCGDRQGIEIGSRALLLHQRAENPHFDGVERSGVSHEVAAESVPGGYQMKIGRSTSRSKSHS